MKYTVVMRGPVPAERRSELEQQLESSLGISAGAASKLAGRRSGRLLKPTTQAKAEQLFGIFQGVGATVELSEVPEEGVDTGLGVPASGADSDKLVVRAGSVPAADDPFGVPSMPVSDPFADPFALPADPEAMSASAASTASPSVAHAPAEDAILAELQGLQPEPQGTADAAEDDPWADFANSLGADTPGVDASAAEDDPWADFAEGLKVDVPEAPLEEERPAPLVGTFMELGEVEQSSREKGPRQELAKQFALGMMAPVGGAALLALVVAAIFAPVGAKAQVLIPLLVVLILGVGAAYYWATSLARELLAQPLARLLSAARAISEGNLDQPVRADENNEIGDVAEALDRMRVSLDAAMSRLRRKR